MFKKKGVGCFLGVIALCWTSGGQAEEMPKPDAAAVWKFITQDSSYKNWERLPEELKTHSSFVPDTDVQKTYANKQALESTELPLNNESMVVKYNLSPANEVKAITIMYKVKGYNPTAGDWFWVQYGPDGEVQEEGKPESCIGCHSKRVDNDYILAHKLAGGLK